MKKKKKSSKPQPLVLPYLPEDIITDILTRLPVKTLIKFRCVAKSWLNMISNPNFINTHLVKSSKANNIQQKVILLYKNIVPGSLGADSYYLKSHSIFSTSRDHGHSVELDYRSSKIVGSCNGLVCIVMQENAFFIWNPSTRDSKKFSVFDKSLGVTNCFGFGYDRLTHDYKVVHMEFNYGQYYGKDEVRVYSLRTNSWKKIGDLSNGNPDPDMGKFVNGALHWTVWDLTGSFPSFVIVSFDLGNETYGEITQPNYGVNYFTQSLIVFEGCISLFCNFLDIRADIWVMKEYDVRDSWVKLYTIPYTNFLKKIGKMEFLLASYMTDEIWLRLSEMLMIYNTNSGTFRRQRNYGSFRSQRIRNMLTSLQDTTVYVESLVSP